MIVPLDGTWLLSAPRVSLLSSTPPSLRTSGSPVAETGPSRGGDGGTGGSGMLGPRRVHMGASGRTAPPGGGGGGGTPGGTGGGAGREGLGQHSGRRTDQSRQGDHGQPMQRRPASETKGGDAREQQRQVRQGVASADVVPWERRRRIAWKTAGRRGMEVGTAREAERSQGGCDARFFTLARSNSLRAAKCLLASQSPPALTRALGLFSTCFFTTFITPLGRRASKRKTLSQM